MGRNGDVFWDNEGNAEYWKKQKDGKADIFRCYVKFDARNDLLDLTDLNVEKRLDQFIRLASKEPKLQYLKKASIGDKIDFFCEKCNVKLVKFFGKYPKTSQTELLDSENRVQKLTNQVKVIYCVKRRKWWNFYWKHRKELNDMSLLNRMDKLIEGLESGDTKFLESLDAEFYEYAQQQKKNGINR